MLSVVRQEVISKMSERVANDPFGQDKARGQLAIVSRGAHHDSDALAFDADFERLLHREFIGSAAGAV